MEFKAGRYEKLERLRCHIASWLGKLAPRTGIEASLDYGVSHLRRPNRNSPSNRIPVASVWIRFSSDIDNTHLNMFAIPVQTGWQIIIPNCGLNRGPDWFFVASEAEVADRFESGLDFWLGCADN